MGRRRKKGNGTWAASLSAHECKVMRSNILFKYIYMYRGGGIHAHMHGKLASGTGGVRSDFIAA